MQNDKFYFPYSYKTVGQVNGTINQISKKLALYSSQETLENLEKEDIDDIIYRCEKAALSCRKSLEDKEIFQENPQKILESLEENYEIKIEFSDGILRIFTPYTFKKFGRKTNAKENFMLMDYLQLALKKWQKANNFSLAYSIKTPIAFFIIRKGITFNRIKICDNDNLENGKIVNEIMRALHCSDNVEVMDLYSCFRETTNKCDCGMEFIVVSRDRTYEIFEEITL